MDIKNLSIVRQSFAGAVFTHQVHEFAASKKREKAQQIKKLNILLVSIVLVLLVLQAAKQDNLIFSYLASGLTVAEIIFLITQLTFNFENESLLHKNSALKYMSLRDRYRLLITDIMNEKSSKKDILERRNALQNEYQSISDLSPSTSEADYLGAQKLLGLSGVGEQFTWSDKEIDRFLPQEFRLTSLKKKSL